MLLLVAALFSLVLVGVSIPLLRRAQFVDNPNHRSSHTQPTPRGGGVAVVAVAVGMSLSASEFSAELVVLAVITLALAAVGLVDDLRSLPSSARLAVQFVGAGVLGSVLLERGVQSWWWLPVMVIAIVGYVNAFNFMDGVNGISALTATVVGVYWAWVGHDQAHEPLYVLGLVTAGAALGFLPWNAPRAKVFLGDVGSYGLGLLLVGMSVMAFTDGLPWLWSVAPLVIYGADTGWVLAKRFKNGRSLTEAHREHVYQQLVDGGWPHLASSLWCALAGAAVCALALGGMAVAVLAGSLVVLAYLGSPITARGRVAV